MRKFPVLWIISTICRYLGGIAVVIGMICILAAFTSHQNNDSLASTGNAVSAFAWFVAGAALVGSGLMQILISEVARIFVYIEYNEKNPNVGPGTQPIR
ncbi:MAG TPA: hypothetical protein VFE70_05040 [Candidatus Elarobacter sp.]|nr:hypothetical protein [Candidatus Elarobacter sp.]